MILTDSEIAEICCEVAQSTNCDITYARAIEAAIIEKLTQSLGLYDVRPANIWRHFYPNVNGTFIKLEELKEKLK